MDGGLRKRLLLVSRRCDNLSEKPTKWSSKPNLVRQRFAKPSVIRKDVQVRVLPAPPVLFAANVVGSEGMLAKSSFMAKCEYLLMLQS